MATFYHSRLNTAQPSHARRHISQAPRSFDITGMMSSINMDIPADSCFATAEMALHTTPSQQHFARRLGTEADPSLRMPSEMFRENALPLGLSMDATFVDAFDMASSLVPPMYGSISWGSIQQPQMCHPSAFRLEDYGVMNTEGYIKSEDPPTMTARSLCEPSVSMRSPESILPAATIEDSKPAIFSTDIDTLMRTIQAKADGADASQCERRRAQQSMPSRPRKRYTCVIPDCGKAFHQKTHLDIHMRAHTGVKPFVCKETSCGQRFSQLGNLKTHERRHTGERPYQCDVCGKAFAQHGNVRAHKIVHTATKPFTCKLDNCNKQFTQLGNLKSHQNKFHVDTIRRLKDRFENFQEGDRVDKWEKEMWEYFGGLYKNCNKGIRGRGKDRRIGTTSIVSERSPSSSVESIDTSHSSST